MRVCFAIAGLMIAVASTGCVQTTKEAIWGNRIGTRAISQDRTMTESYSEHIHRNNAIIDQDAAALVEDWDLFLHRDRRSRLTRWHVR